MDTIQHDYKLHVTKHQAAVIKRFLEMTTRISWGQLEIIRDIIANHPDRNLPDFQHTTKIFDDLKLLFFPELPVGAHHGFNSEKLSRDSHTAWDIVQVIRKVLAEDNGEDVMSANHSAFMKASKLGDPDPKIEKSKTE
jgi:hypothetical protein